MLMDYFGADRRVHGERNLQTRRSEKQRYLGVRHVGLVRQRPSEGFSHSPSLLHSTREGLVHATTCLVSHSERSVQKPARYVFGSRSEPGYLVVVYCPRSVCCEMSDDAALHQIDQNRSDTSLHDVAAEHDDNTASESVSVDDRVYDRPKIGGDENIGERAH